MKHLNSFALFEYKYRYSVGQVLSDADAQLILDLLRDMKQMEIPLPNGGSRLAINRSASGDNSIKYFPAGYPKSESEWGKAFMKGLKGGVIITHHSQTNSKSPASYWAGVIHMDLDRMEGVSDISIRKVLQHEMAHHWQGLSWLMDNKRQKFLDSSRKEREKMAQLFPDAHLMHHEEIGANLATFYDAFKIWVQDPEHREKARASLRSGDLISIFLGEDGVLAGDPAFRDFFLFYFGDPEESPLPWFKERGKGVYRSGGFRKNLPEVYAKVLRSFLVTLSSILNKTEDEVEEEAQILVRTNLRDHSHQKMFWEKYHDRVEISFV